MFRRCKLCNLPENYTNIWFNDEDVLREILKKYYNVDYDKICKKIKCIREDNNGQGNWYFF